MKADTQSTSRAVPRRRKPSMATRARPFWILWLVLAALLVWGGVWLSRSPWFRIARTTIVVPAGAPVTRDAVAVAAAVPPDANLWLLDPGAMARRIEAIPYVDRASIGRAQFPQPALEIAVTVRTPSVCVRAGGNDATIDGTARVLRAGCAAAGLPLIDAGDAAVPAPGGRIADARVSGLLADAQVLAAAGVAVRQLRRDRWGGLEAIDPTGVTIEFGDDADLARKAALVQPVRNGIGSKRPIRAIDLRAPDTPTVQFR